MRGNCIGRRAVDFQKKKYLLNYRRKEVGVVQYFALIEDMNIYRNVALPLKSRGWEAGRSGICISVTAKLNRNLHRYGIEIMNGQSTGTILAAFLLEILLIIAAAMGLAVWQFMDMIRYNLVFLWMILGFGLLAAAVTSLIFIRKLRTVDIEEIIRREE